MALATLGAVSGAVLVAPTVTGRAAPSPPVIVAWAVALAAPLLVRRRFPCTVLVLTVLHFPFYWPLGQLHEIASWLVLGVAVYSAAAYGRRPRAAWCAGTALVASSALFAVSALLAGVAPASVAVFGVENALPYVLGWTSGHMTRAVAREYHATLEERNAELDRTPRGAGPPGPSSRSGCGSRASCTTSSPTTSRSSVLRPGVAARMFTDQPEVAR